MIWIPAAINCGFLLTRPMRGATRLMLPVVILPAFLLTRPMRGATDPLQQIDDTCRISTHTPHAGRDGINSLNGWRDEISTHTPHAGRDWRVRSDRIRLDISTHTPHAGRDKIKAQEFEYNNHFYSHAPCGARQGKHRVGKVYMGFLLTRPMRGATGLSDERILF